MQIAGCACVLARRETQFLKRLRVFALLGVILVGAGLWAEKATACGTVDLTYKMFKSAVASGDTQKLGTALNIFSEGCKIYHTYEPGRSDRQILEILLYMMSPDALQPDVFVGWRPVQVFRQFNCLYPARGLDGYKRVAFAGLCDFEEMESWLVAQAPGDTHIRSGPGSDSEKLGLISNHALVDEISRSGEWVQVETRRHATIYERPVFRGWIHASLLARYREILAQEEISD